MSNLQIQIRNFRPEDLSFVMDSWMRSFAKSKANPFLHQGRINKLYFKYQTMLINQLLNQSQVLIACNPADENEIYGWIVYQLKGGFLITHFAFTKMHYRQFGVFNRLMDQIQFDNKSIIVTHPTYAVEFLGKKLDLKQMPELAFE